MPGVCARTDEDPIAKIRQPRRCRAHSSRTGKPCRAYAVVGGDVCRAHGGAIIRVRVVAAQRRERELVERAMVVAEQRQAREIEAWIAERIEAAAELLGKPPEAITPEDVRRCSLLDGRPDPFDPPPRLRLDLRLIPRRPVVIRRR
jgi:hypothetical protein